MEEWGAEGMASWREGCSRNQQWQPKRCEEEAAYQGFKSG